MNNFELLQELMSELKSIKTVNRMLSERVDILAGKVEDLESKLLGCSKMRSIMGHDWRQKLDDKCRGNNRNYNNFIDSDIAQRSQCESTEQADYSRMCYYQQLTDLTLDQLVTYDEAFNPLIFDVCEGYERKNPIATYENIVKDITKFRMKDYPELIPTMELLLMTAKTPEDSIINPYAPGQLSRKYLEWYVRMFEKVWYLFKINYDNLLPFGTRLWQFDFGKWDSVVDIYYNYRVNSNMGEIPNTREQLCYILHEAKIAFERHRDGIFGENIESTKSNTMQNSISQKVIPQPADWASDIMEESMRRMNDLKKDMDESHETSSEILKKQPNLMADINEMVKERTKESPMNTPDVLEVKGGVPEFANEETPPPDGFSYDDTEDTFKSSPVSQTLDELDKRIEKR